MMSNQQATLASKVVSLATLLALLPPAVWLMWMAFPTARQALIASPERHDLNPVAFWIALAIAVSISMCLVLALAFLSVSTLLGRVQSDRPMFFALNAIWAYIGVFALLSRLPGLTLLFRSTFTASNFGWLLVVATGLPIWGPLMLWFFGTARPASSRWTFKRGSPSDAPQQSAKRFDGG